MSVDVGSAVGYLDLDISGFVKGLNEAQTIAESAISNITKGLSESFAFIAPKIVEPFKEASTDIEQTFNQAAQKIEEPFKGVTDGIEREWVSANQSMLKTSQDMAGNVTYYYTNSAGEIESSYTFTAEQIKNSFKQSAEEAAKTLAQKMQEAVKHVQDAGKALQDFGKSMSLYVTAPIMGAGTALLKFGSDFEKEMTNVKAITGYSADEMKRLEEGIGDIAISTGKSMKEVASAAKMVAEAGGDMNATLAQLEHGTNLAVATQTDLATTLDMVGSTMKTFGLNSEDAATQVSNTQRVVDSLASVTTRANTELTDIRQAFVNVGGAASNAGLSVDEVNAMLIRFADAGLKGGQAGTALNGVLRNLTTPTEEAAFALSQMGVELYDISTGSARDMVDIMDDVVKSLDQMTDQQRAATESVLFDNVSMKSWNTVRKEGIQSIRELTAELEGSVDAYEGVGQAAGMAAIQQEGLNAQLASIYPYLEKLGNSLLEILKPAIIEIFDKIKEWLDWLDKLDAGTKQTIVYIGLFAAAIGPVVYVLGTFMTSLASISTATKTLSTVMSGLGSSFTVLSSAIGLILSPIGLVVIAIGGLVAAFIYLWNTNEDFRIAIASIWKEISEILEGIWKDLQSVLKDLGFEFDSFSEFATFVWKKLTDFLSATFIAAFEIILDSLKWFTYTLKGILDVFIGIFTLDWEKFCEGLYEIFAAPIERLRRLWNSTVGWIIGVIDGINVKAEEAKSKALDEQIAALKNRLPKDMEEALDSTLPVVDEWSDMVNQMMYGAFDIDEMFGTAEEKIQSLSILTRAEAKAAEKEAKQSAKEAEKAAEKAAKEAEREWLRASKEINKSVENSMDVDFSKAVDGLKSGLENAFSDFDPLNSDEWDAAIGNAAQLIFAMFDTIDLSLADIGRKINGFLIDQFINLIDSIQDAGDVAERVFSRVFDGIDNRVDNLIQKVSQLVTMASSISASANYAPSISLGGTTGSKSGSVATDYSNQMGYDSSGGNTYNFYSPEPISEAVARREFEQLQRQMAFGF